MDKELLDAGYRAYTGEKIDVYFNTAIDDMSAFGQLQHGDMSAFGQLRAGKRETV